MIRALPLIWTLALLTSFIYALPGQDWSEDDEASASALIRLWSPESRSSDADVGNVPSADSTLKGTGQPLPVPVYESWEDRKKKIFLLYEKGVAAKEIARDLDLKYSTVQSIIYREQIKRKQKGTPCVRLSKGDARQDGSGTALRITEPPQRPQGERDTNVALPLEAGLPQVVDLNQPAVGKVINVVRKMPFDRLRAPERQLRHKAVYREYQSGVSPEDVAKSRHYDMSWIVRAERKKSRLGAEKEDDEGDTHPPKKQKVDRSRLTGFAGP